MIENLRSESCHFFVCTHISICLRLQSILRFFCFCLNHDYWDLKNDSAQISINFLDCGISFENYTFSHLLPTYGDGCLSRFVHFNTVLEKTPSTEYKIETLKVLLVQKNEWTWNWKMRNSAHMRNEAKKERMQNNNNKWIKMLTDKNEPNKIICYFNWKRCGCWCEHRKRQPMCTVYMRLRRKQPAIAAVVCGTHSWTTIDFLLLHLYTTSFALWFGSAHKLLFAQRLAPTHNTPSRARVSLHGHMYIHRRCSA